MESEESCLSLCSNIVPDDFEQPWNIVRSYRDICRQLNSSVGLELELNQLLQRTLVTTPLSQATKQLVANWQSDIASEVSAVINAGPAYVGACIEQFAHSASVVCAWNSSKVGMPAVMRWSILCNALREIGFHGEADIYQRSIERLYGPRDYLCQVPVQNSVLAELFMVSDRLPQMIMRSPLMSLRGSSLI